MDISLTHILKEISRFTAADPFNDDFDKNKFLELVQSYINIHYKDNKLTEEKIGEEIIKVIFYFNDIYENLVIEIETIIDKINLDKLDLVELVYAHTNFNYFTIIDNVKKTITNNTSSVPVNFEDKTYTNIINVFGDTLSSHDAVDISIDISNRLLGIIASFDPKHNKKLPLLTTPELHYNLQTLILTTNFLINLEGLYDFYRYELGSISKEGKILKFKSDPQYYSLLKAAGKQRRDNLVHESYLRLLKYPVCQFFASNYSLSRGAINLKGSIFETKDPFLQDSTCELATFYNYLIDIKLSKIDNLSFIDLLNIINQFKALLNSIKSGEVISKALESQDIKEVPFKIKTDILVSFLNKSTKIKKKPIEKFLQNLSQTLSEGINSWKKPLLKQSGYFYFLFPTIKNAHYIYLLDLILKNEISSSKRKNLFKIYIKQELESLKNLKYGFKSIDDKTIKKLIDDSSNTLIYETKELFIAIEICVYDFPIESIEYDATLNALGEASESLNSKKKQLINNLHKSGENQKEIVGIILSNYPTFSGMTINGNFASDEYLLLNYLEVGKYRRGRLLMGNNILESQDLASYNYYENEEEFNLNFKNFFQDPAPVREILNLYKIEEKQIDFELIDYKIFIEDIQVICLKSTVGFLLNNLHYYLKQLYYFETDFSRTLIKDKKHIESKIHFYIPQILGFIAFDNEDRYSRIELLDVFKDVNFTGLSYLLYYLNNSLVQTSRKKILKKNKSIHHNTNFEQAEEDLKNIIFFNFGNKNNISELSLSSINLTHNLTDERIVNVIEYLIDLLSSLKQKDYTIEELDKFFFIIILFAGLAHNKSYYQEKIYITFTNLIDALNFSRRYQKARDVSEDILQYYFNKENLPLIGWLCLFRCYTKQHIIFDATLYGNLIFTIINALPEVEEYVISESYYQAMLYFRNFGNEELVENLYEAISTLNLSIYEKQKITLSYFNSFLHRPSKSIEEILPKFQIYLSDNIDEICSFGQTGALPWLSFLYNTKNLQIKGIINDKIDFIDYEAKLASEIDPITLERFKASFFPIPEITKLLLIEALSTVLETRSFEDLASELMDLELLAKNAFLLSIEPLDINSILLIGLVINDSSLTFKPKIAVDKAKFTDSFSKEIYEQLSTYDKYIINNLIIGNEQLVCWIFEIYTEVYKLTISFPKNIKLTKLVNWNYNGMASWLNNISEFYFDDKGDYPINSQEQDYSKLLETLNFSNLEIEDNFQELLVFSSIKMAAFPHNLLQNSALEFENFNLHEEPVRSKIEKSISDFISFHKPVTNIVSLEWYVENGRNLVLKNEDFEIDCWIPIEDGDIPIILGYEKLKPLIEEKYKCTIQTNISPKAPLSSTINIYLAHGGKGFEGFRTIHTKSNEGHAFHRKKGIEALFGNGTIAILFICDSASISKDLFSSKLTSLANQILELGYKAVVASAWKYNPEISATWLTIFLESLEMGDKISAAVHKANINVAKFGYNEYHGFYAPTGWASMHLFGNPNISFE